MWNAEAETVPTTSRSGRGAPSNIEQPKNRALVHQYSGGVARPPRG